MTGQKSSRALGLPLCNGLFDHLCNFQKVSRDVDVDVDAVAVAVAVDVDVDAVAVAVVVVVVVVVVLHGGCLPLNEQHDGGRGPGMSGDLYDVCHGDQYLWLGTSGSGFQSELQKGFVESMEQRGGYRRACWVLCATSFVGLHFQGNAG